MAVSFREELHAIDAVLAGDGIAILRDVVVADDLAAGNLVKVLAFALPGYGFYPIYSADHPGRAVIETFVNRLGQTALKAIEIPSSILAMLRHSCGYALTDPGHDTRSLQASTWDTTVRF